MPMKKSLTFVLGILFMSLIGGYIYSQGQTESSIETSSEFSYEFVADPGYRIDYASNPLFLDVSENGVTLAYEYRTKGLKASPEEGIRVTSSQDGLNFNVGQAPDRPVAPKGVQLPDGSYIRYEYDQKENVLMSYSSPDGDRYELKGEKAYNFNTSDLFSQPGFTFGVHTQFLDNQGGVVLLHNRTDENENIVVTELYAAPESEGRSFELRGENILGGSIKEEFYADPNAIILPNGNIFLVVMSQEDGSKPPMARQGVIHGYLSKDQGVSFTLTGTLVSYEDYSDLDAYSLNDPKLVLMPDGALKIYVAAMVPNEDSQDENSFKWIIVSASNE